MGGVVRMGLPLYGEIMGLYRNRPAYSYHVCDAVADLPTVNVKTGDLAYAIAEETIWIKKSAAWVLVDSGILSIGGVITVSDTTDATTKDTGSIITEGGIGVEKAIYSGTSITATTYFYIGDSVTNGSYRMYVSGSDLITERRESGSWVEKSRVLG
jgi:hypothetical protein